MTPGRLIDCETIAAVLAQACEVVEKAVLSVVDWAVGGTVECHVNVVRSEAAQSILNDEKRSRFLYRVQVGGEFDVDTVGGLGGIAPASEMLSL